jgi:hypothetical protein
LADSIYALQIHFRHPNPPDRIAGIALCFHFGHLGNISIEQPLNGTVYEPGDNIVVSVPESKLINAALIATPFDAIIDETPPYSANFVIPLDYIGALPISALGRDSNGIIGSSLITVGHL